MPGFKQMVVKVKRQDTDPGRSSTDGGAAAAAGIVSPPSLNGGLNPSDQRGVSSIYGATPGTTVVDGDVRTPLNLPFYDTSPMPPSELITHLANTFFSHLGCNYPFLQRERFLRDLEEKQVDAILVDAVCALAARFSTHSLLTEQSHDENKATPPEYGHAFAQRAKTALVDTFPCPSVAAVQAALLLAYNEFGESRDSGLWMYLGISIRMAQDLGMHKLEGLKYKGKNGPTPKMIKRESMSGSPELPLKLVGGDRARRKSETPREKVIHESAEGMVEATDQEDEEEEVDEQKAVEQERVDTFWAVFFLDRVVSSGTGRRSTLRDKDIELSFPALDETDPKTGWPSCFPALIRIVHLYGRVADLLNSIKEPSDITTETPKRLAGMESQVTNFYQGLSSRLHFDAVNFQHYMKVGEGTNFVLLHFWFHTLIVLLHQPTLLKTFEGRMLQLFPNSRQLSISSAKTIADILSYSQLMDAKASLGNPFTTQPIYIAACAFLKETVEQTATSNAQSRATSPTRREKHEKWSGFEGASRPGSSMNGTPTQAKRMSISDLSNHTNMDSANGEGSTHRRNSSITVEQNKSSDKSEGSALSAARTASALAKHTLLATAASQHYKLCYKALQSLETYWAGAKYILTVLDQKFEGVGDPLLYTVEEGESAMERPRPEPSFTTPGWRRKLSWGPYLYNPNVVGSQDFWMEKAGQMPGSPSDLTKGKMTPDKLCGSGRAANTRSRVAIGWTLTGTMNSPSTNLAWHYPSGATANGHASASQQQPATSIPPFDNGIGQAEFDASAQQNMQYPGHLRTASSTSQQPAALTSYPSNASADMLMGLNSPYQTNSNPSHDNAPNPDPFAHLHPANTNDAFTSTGAPNNSGRVTSTDGFNGFNAWTYPNLWNPNGGSSAMQSFGDMMIESQDVDMSMLGLDMMPWFDSYPSHDLNDLFDPGNATDPHGAGVPSTATNGAQGTPRG